MSTAVSVLNYCESKMSAFEITQRSLYVKSESLTDDKIIFIGHRFNHITLDGRKLKKEKKKGSATSWKRSFEPTRKPSLK